MLDSFSCCNQDPPAWHWQLRRLTYQASTSKESGILSCSSKNGLRELLWLVQPGQEVFPRSISLTSWLDDSVFQELSPGFWSCFLEKRNFHEPGRHRKNYSILFLLKKKSTIVDLQCCVRFWYTAKWLRYIDICIYITFFLIIGYYKILNIVPCIIQ